MTNWGPPPGTIVAVLMVLSFPALAATITGTVQLAVVAPITLTKNSDLEFGGLFAGASAGNVVIDPTTGSRTTSGGVTAATASFSPAQFTVTGDANARVQIDIPNGSMFINRVGGGAQMRVRQFRRQQFIPNAPRLNGSGTLFFNVGATLDVGANQMPGRYTGTFDVTVDYQ